MTRSQFLKTVLVSALALFLPIPALTDKRKRGVVVNLGRGNLHDTSRGYKYHTHFSGIKHQGYPKDAWITSIFEDDDGNLYVKFNGSKKFPVVNEGEFYPELTLKEFQELQK